MLILGPQILQLHDGYVHIDVAEIDGPAVSGDITPVHTRARSAVAFHPSSVVFIGANQCP